ncbi:ABC transporter substrate-binding protein [Rhizobium sp. CG5]|uniref:ABC transporter substrate-binding protein n=1 Tax=Rhizobium sp. CG5 TaxID=2726076 RepID=UPI00203486C8|nr:ABC transporter substrate-binding protein [Rhizobium sp. CG5]MCM2477826.1 ABC transporter substrate-binding protein [Rhizobium sp. CG5]
MCDRHDHWTKPEFKSLDLTRRSLLKAATAATITMAVSPTLFGGHAHAADAGAVKSTHGNGFCNLNLFLAHAEQLAREDGLEIEFVIAPSFSDQVTMIGSGMVDVGVMPYTSFLALYDAGAPVKVVAGGGIQGCMLVAQPGLDTPEKLKGKTLGTFQLDTLEVMPYDWLKAKDIPFSDITVRYLGSMAEAVEGFMAGAIDMVCVIEPYGTALLNDKPGSVLLSDGIDIYGKNYTDCILASRAELMMENPATLKALIKAMMKAQAMAEADIEATLGKVVGTYYKTSLENARIAQRAQPSVIDMRDQKTFILERTDSLIEMGYIKKKPTDDAIDWTLLEQVIAENPDLYASLKMKAA